MVFIMKPKKRLNFFKENLEEAREYIKQFDAPSTERKERNKLSYFFQWCHKHHPAINNILDVDAKIFREFFQHIDAKDIQVRAKTRYLSAIKKFINHLILPILVENESQITRNYSLIFSKRFYTFKMGGETRNAPVLTRDDVLDCLRFFRDRNYRDYLLFSILAYTGMRVVGAVHIQVKNISFTQRAIKTQEKRTKRSAGVNIYIFPKKLRIPIKSYIAEFHLDAQDPLFAISTKNIRKQLKKWRHRAHPHQFRDTLNTLFFEGGLEESLRMVLLNQNPGMNVKHYVKKYLRDLSARRELYDRYFPY
jgi:integrase